MMATGLAVVAALGAAQAAPFGSISWGNPIMLGDLHGFIKPGSQVELAGGVGSDHDHSCVAPFHHRRRRTPRLFIIRAHAHCGILSGICRNVPSRPRNAPGANVIMLLL